MKILDDAVAELMKLDQASVVALADIARERVRQISREGWTPEHDDAHSRGELAVAGGCYAIHAHEVPSPEARAMPAPKAWPWEAKWWKPSSPARDCERAGALVIAEMARHYRSAPQASNLDR